MSASVLQVIESDCSILMLRALLEKQVVAFGDDGLGKHGRCDQPQYFTIEDVQVDVLDPEDDEIYGIVFLKLLGYNSSKFGDICTDQNFLISIQKLLSAHHIDPACLTYGEIDIQGTTFVAMHLNVGLLLDWA